MRIELVAREDFSDKIILSAALDPTGAIDLAAWVADPAPWPFQRGTLTGDLIRIDELWALRADGNDDAPLWLLDLSLLRPGETVALRAPSGDTTSFLIVAVTQYIMAYSRAVRMSPARLSRSL